MKIENFEKRKKWSGDVVERELPTNLAWIHAAVSEKLEFTDGWTDDERLRHDSSSADKVKQQAKNYSTCSFSQHIHYIKKEISLDFAVTTKNIIEIICENERICSL